MTSICAITGKRKRLSRGRGRCFPAWQEKKGDRRNLTSTYARERAGRHRDAELLRQEEIKKKKKIDRKPVEAAFSKTPTEKEEESQYCRRQKGGRTRSLLILQIMEREKVLTERDDLQEKKSCRRKRLSL